MAETQRTSPEVTVEQDEFLRLMNKAIRPKSEEARTAVEQAVKTLAAQALESLRRAGVALTRAEAAGPGSVTTVDYRDRGGLCLRRIDVPGLGHEWTGGPGGHRQ